jgi:protein SCO1/2
MNDSMEERAAVSTTGRRRFLGLALAGTLLIAGCTPSKKKPKLTGTQLNGGDSPDFSLTDQNGATVSLSDFRGKAVALAFIFTNCPDICPLIASQMRAAYDLLDEDQRDDVVFLGVTVDPERDTPEALQAFSQRYELDSVANWHALYADRQTLEAVWASYGIEATEIADEVNDHINGSAAVATIRHTDAIYLIDKDGKQRSLLHSDVDPQDFADDLETLAA